MKGEAIVTDGDVMKEEEEQNRISTKRERAIVRL